MFHVSVDPGLRDGTRVQQGQVIGHISGPGEAGFAGTPHLHFSLWKTSDGGNWSRTAVPFTGAYAIAGREFPDIGGSNQYRGTEIQV
jgi:murein DD-endopeptidase MepM/ murein hydrolase activator NlpD